MLLHRLHGCPVVVHADFTGFCFSRTSASFLNSCWNISLPGVHVDGEVLKRQRAASSRTWADISALPTSASPSTNGAVVCALETRLLETVDSWCDPDVVQTPHTR